MKRKSTYVKLNKLLFTHRRFTGIFTCPVTLLLVACFLLTASVPAKSQCNDAPSMVFTNPVLIGGVDGQPGAIYRFDNVVAGIDATIEIMGLYGGALLGEIDNTTQGYFDAWQPYVTAGANDTSYLEWRITFKMAGTNTDTVLPCLAITAVDVDGDDDQLKEFIQAATPGAYAVDAATTLSITFDGVYNRAIGQITTIPLIDTFHREAMFQMNFANISSVIYRNGSISTKDDIDVRHTCIYFKPFFLNDFVTLPVKLLSFRATAINQAIQLSWQVTEEKNMLYYTVQKSSDGLMWKDINRVTALNQPYNVHTYYSNDNEKLPGKTYYRLQQTDHKQAVTYSYIIHTGNEQGPAITVHSPTLVSKSFSLRIITDATDSYTLQIYTLQGQLSRHQQFMVQPGTTNITVPMPLASTGTAYLLTLTNKQGNRIYTKKIISQ